ncbi:MAG: hypothetical protein A2511_03070 [Deltaproteobacteria bacterium RIFOXYD12_FULL_50_9]|nr:MAG: hypothetical protein A2511_03070 [Deltaproteobacteria bacterium RIFOXYD12_FULL_50_9]
MKPVKEIKKVQVAGKKHFMPAEDAEVEKLIQRGRSLKVKMDTTKKELDVVQDRLVEIAQARREGTTTVTLAGITAQVPDHLPEVFCCQQRDRGYCCSPWSAVCEIF